MLWYIIDGWNVVYKIPAIKNSPSPKEDFVLFVKKNRLTGSSNNRVTIVFDGKMDLRFKKSEHQFEILFSGRKSADKVICEKVSAHINKHEIIVVSDDNEIINYIRAEGASFKGVREFLSRARKKKKENSSEKISYAVKKEITDELRKIWLKE